MPETLRQFGPKIRRPTTTTANGRMSTSPPHRITLNTWARFMVTLLPRIEETAYVLIVARLLRNEIRARYRDESKGVKIS
jgi:hypothetical protein